MVAIKEQRTDISEAAGDSQRQSPLNDLIARTPRKAVAGGGAWQDNETPVKAAQAGLEQAWDILPTLQFTGTRFLSSSSA